MSVAIVPSPVGPPDTPWLIEFRRDYAHAKKVGATGRLDDLRLALIGKMADAREWLEWYELIEAAKCVRKTEKPG